MKLTRVETLASEPELWMDEHKRAHWIDGSRVTDHDLQALPGSEALLAAVVRNGLTVLAAGDGGIEREELPCADPCEYDGCDRHHGQLAPSEQTRVGQHCSVCNRRFSVLSGSVMGCAVHGIQDTMEHREARKRILLGAITDTARDQSLRVNEPRNVECPECGMGYRTTKPITPKKIRLDAIDAALALRDLWYAQRDVTSMLPRDVIEGCARALGLQFNELFQAAIKDQEVK